MVELLDLLGINWAALLATILRLLVAFLFALPIAWEREHSTRLMGLRTFPIVALASCGYVLITQSLAAENHVVQARLLQGLMTGIGFIGGGAILKNHDSVHGTATAASIWSTGAIGAAVAFDRYEIAIALSMLNFLVFQLVTPLKSSVTIQNKDGTDAPVKDIERTN